MYLKWAYSGNYSDILSLFRIKFREAGGSLNPTLDGLGILEVLPDFRELGNFEDRDRLWYFYLSIENRPKRTRIDIFYKNVVTTRV